VWGGKKKRDFLQGGADRHIQFYQHKHIFALSAFQSSGFRLAEVFPLSASLFTFFRGISFAVYVSGFIIHHNSRKSKPHHVIF